MSKCCVRVAGWILAERYINKVLTHLVYTQGKVVETLEQAVAAQVLPIPETYDASGQPVNTGSDLLLALHQCPFLNVSVCEASVKHSLSNDAFLVVVYNPLAWPRETPVQVPLEYDSEASWAVKGDHLH